MRFEAMRDQAFRTKPVRARSSRRVLMERTTMSHRRALCVDILATMLAYHLIADSPAIPNPSGAFCTNRTRAQPHRQLPMPSRHSPAKQHIMHCIEMISV